MHGAIERETNGITFLERPGSGSVVVFLHGIGSNAASFASLFDLLPEDMRLIAWNAPGYRGSRPLAAQWPVAADYADRLADLFDGLTIGSAKVVGHSLGVLVGASFAVRHPERVSHLTLASCACGYGVAPGGTLPATVTSRIEDLAQFGPAAFAQKRAPRLVFAPHLNPEIVARVEGAMSQVEASGYGQAVHMLGAGDLKSELRRVTQQVDFITGVEDLVTPEQQTVDAAQAWAAASGLHPQISRIGDAGHAVYQQKPQEFTDALLGFWFGKAGDGAGRTSPASGGKDE